VNVNRYTFRHLWWLPARPASVYFVLERIQDYPLWWPEVRSVRRFDADVDAAEIVIRSVLPYDLALVARHSRRDPEAGVLEAELSGDVAGFARWWLTAADGGSSVLYEQQVEACKPLLRRLGLVARPAFRANHWLMMRHCYQQLLREFRGHRSEP
jgi:hypothetical protein